MTNPRALSSHRQAVLDEVKRLCEQAGRSSDEIRIVAVTKGFPPSLVQSAVDSGFTLVGESYVQEALRKKQQITVARAKRVGWHFIGHLQSNKVRKILGEFDLIHSVDRLSLVNELQKRLDRADKHQKILMQVNVHGETSKFGVAPEQAPSLMESILERESLELIGLMTMAPLTEDKRRLRSIFAACRRLRDELASTFDHRLPELSMGMTNDYPQAIVEGATMLRLGRRLFGERPDSE